MSERKPAWLSDLDPRTRRMVLLLVKHHRRLAVAKLGCAELHFNGQRVSLKLVEALGSEVLERDDGSPGAT